MVISIEILIILIPGNIKFCNRGENTRGYTVGIVKAGGSGGGTGEAKEITSLYAV